MKWVPLASTSRPWAPESWAVPREAEKLHGARAGWVRRGESRAQTGLGLRPGLSRPSTQQPSGTWQNHSGLTSHTHPGRPPQSSAALLMLASAQGCSADQEVCASQGRRCSTERLTDQLRTSWLETTGPCSVLLSGSPLLGILPGLGQQNRHDGNAAAGHASGGRGLLALQGSLLLPRESSAQPSSRERGPGASHCLGRGR